MKAPGDIFAADLARGKLNMIQAGDGDDGPCLIRRQLLLGLFENILAFKEFIQLPGIARGMDWDTVKINRPDGKMGADVKLFDHLPDMVIHQHASSPLQIVKYDDKDRNIVKRDP